LCKMIDNLEKLDKIHGFKRLLEQISGGKVSINVGGMVGSSRALLASWLFLKTGRTVLFITPDTESSEKAYDDFIAYLGEDKVEQFPSWEVQPYEIRAPHAENVGDRLKTLHDLLRGQQMIISAPAVALLEPTIERHKLEKVVLALSPGIAINQEDLKARLVEMGFSRQPVVEQLGDFAVRGGIIDIFPATRSEPIRVEFFGDEIESIRTFSVLTQRSLERLKEAVILPLREFPVEMGMVELVSADLPQEQAIALHDALGPEHLFDGLEFFSHLFETRKSSLFSYLPNDAIVIRDDPEQIKEQIEDTLEKAQQRYEERNDYPFGKPEEIYIDYNRIRENIEERGSVNLQGIIKENATDLEIATVPQEPSGPHIKSFAEKLASYKREGKSAVIYCDGESQKRRLSELLSEYDIAVPMETRRISEGFGLSDISLWFLTDHEIFSRITTRKKLRRFKEGIALSSYQSLQPGDFVVHIDHGIGRFHGLETITVDGRKRDCLLIFYAGDDKLYVPIEEFSRVQKFAGKEGAPTLSRLGTGAWERIKARAKKAIMDMAEELIALYAKRQALPGYAFLQDTQWQRELEASFPYEETPDQEKTIADIKSDMEQPSPMDRLVCGDVGYGKTEVAIRAAFKAVESGKQVAVLVPTTILAQQHLNTFRDRLSRFPVKVDMLSRFRLPKEVKAIKEGIKAGTVDIVIGTHMLLQKDLEFKDLGLLVIDEEHRFGVTHKEKIRKLKTQVDTLTLTATPIPRTLQLSLLGARDMSVINTPPKDRLPIITEVALFNDRAIFEAVERELARGGQVFFVHNRVESIDAIYNYLKRLLPAVQIGVGHGQMVERSLERVMLNFLEKKYQVLLATTIIESGLDIPSVNTIIINRADKLGLAQLYQLRGRVGRSTKRAFAYLLVPPLKMLTEKARKRLRAIEEFTELGSGYHLALRDLEIRGAGNILGAQQHGFIEEVGFDLYCRLLEEAVAEIKQTGPAPDKIELKIQTDLDLFVPETYIDDPNLRVELYRNVSNINDTERLAAFAEELSDRFGPLPGALENLLNLAEARILAIKLGVQRLVFKGGELFLEFPEDREFAKSEIEGWHRRVPNKMEFKSFNGLRMQVRLKERSGTILKMTLRSLLG
jgi:transcription-repair coupling factor (superfamily II helicase)